MFDNVGSNIQIISKVIGILGIISGILVLVDDSDMIMASIIIWISSIVSMYLLCGFGIIVANIERISRQNNTIIELMSKEEEYE